MTADELFEDTPPFIVHARERVGSTSDEAKTLARNGAPHGTVVWARSQSAGRGRGGRTWYSPVGNLYASVVLRPAVPFEHLSEVGFVAALGVAEAVRTFLPAQRCVGLKWPNDVLIDGAKVAGILLESETARDTAPWVVVGIGINVAAAPSDAPYPVASLHASGAPDAIPRRVLSATLGALGAWFALWRECGFERVRDAWLRQAAYLQAEVCVRAGEGTVRGRFAGLDDDGAMIVETAQGRRRVSFGDVALVHGGGTGYGSAKSGTGSPSSLARAKT